MLLDGWWRVLGDSPCLQTLLGVAVVASWFVVAVVACWLAVVARSLMMAVVARWFWCLLLQAGFGGCYFE